ncbi:GDP-fucose protein O-fucosyltransferase, partial [Tanacetum coccineum]
FIYVFISLLAPSPDHLHHRLRHAKLTDDEGEVIESNPVSSIFKVPISGGMMSERNLWSTRMSKFYYGCSNASLKFPKVETVTYPNRYLMIATSGGLNQQRTGITDAVVAARILNATLVVPKLDQKSFWKDSSTFSEIFDVEWFISRLSKDVKVIKELPRKGGKVWVPYNMRVPRKCNERCYQIRVLPVLLKKHAVQLSKFDYRLSNKLETDLQKLRCRVNYHALKFTDPINKMGQKLVNRMRKMGKHYVALHLRFEPDMLAFSGCYYGGGEKERKELGKIRKRWKTLHSNNPDKERRQGRCPLTPEEVGLMLRALGYSKDVHLYVASGEVYGGDETLAPLRALFPNIHSKDTIATKEKWIGKDEDDDLMGQQFLQSVNETNVDDDPSVSESPELEEFTPQFGLGLILVSLWLILYIISYTHYGTSAEMIIEAESYKSRSTHQDSNHHTKISFRYCTYYAHKG